MTEKTQKKSTNTSWKLHLAIIVVAQLFLAYYLGTGMLALWLTTTGLYSQQEYGTSEILWTSLLLIPLAVLFGYVLNSQAKVREIIFPKLKRRRGLTLALFISVSLFLSFVAFFNSMLLSL